MEDSEGKLRVFISYSHADDGAAVSIAQALAENGLVPLSDAGFPYGTGFVEQIRSFIAHAHVFLPLVTESSSSRGWVHQEIGYAIAMNIPVLPVVVGEALPQAMMQQLRAVKLGESLEDLRSQLSLPLFGDLVDRYRDPGFATFECAPSIEQRAAMFVKYSQELREMRVTGRVRQKGGLSSFHMPDKRVAHELWRTRYGSIPPTDHQRQLLLDELTALKAHA
ncbi:MAG: toll/interleukin-1 receptor domain-containing protein, partial [Armatimonadota bacterium]